MPPRVTVVIPAWSAYAGPELVEAVNSVRAQTIAADLIVVDNASEVALPPLDGVEVVRLERRRSTGAARNAALSRLHAPYVVFLDADDRLLPGALAALVEGLDSHPSHAAQVLSIVDGMTGRRYRSPRRVARALARVPPVFALLNTIWSLLPTQGCAIMRSADVIACGGYGDSDRGEDWVLGVSISYRGAVAFDGRPGLLYRRRSDSPGSAQLSQAVLLANARRVRARIRHDPAVPRGVRAMLPMIALAQWLAARIAHPAYRGARAMLGPPSLGFRACRQRRMRR